jgi:hypothetical protein
MPLRNSRASSSAAAVNMVPELPAHPAFSSFRLSNKESDHTRRRQPARLPESHRLQQLTSGPATLVAGSGNVPFCDETPALLPAIVDHNLDGEFSARG